MAEPCTVLIAAADLLPGLKQRAGDPGSELLAFSDTEALRALDTITKRRPRVIALERLFAATSRGAALISRIKADPSLSESEIRVISLEGDDARVLPRTAEATAAASAGAAPAATATTAAAPPLDWRGTRRAQRFAIAGKVDVLVDGNPATLVDLSTIGAQVVSGTILKPNQRVRIALPDEQGIIRFNATIAWASFEIPPKTAPRYRAGLAFVDADANTLAAFCSRHKAP